MALTVGRVTLSTPLEIRRVRRRRQEDVEGQGGLIAPQFSQRYTLEYQVRGREQGTSGDANQGVTRANALEKEGGRFGSVYVTDTVSQLTEGYYELGDVEVENPGGRPKGRPWKLMLKHQPQPVVSRQAEDDNVVGSDTADLDAEEEKKVVYTATASDVKVLDPRNMAGAEKVNLPKGDWRIVVRGRAITTTTQKVRAKTTKTDGTQITLGAQKTFAVAGTWEELDLGTFTIGATDDKANWFEILVQANVDLNDVELDRVYLVPA